MAQAQQSLMALPEQVPGQEQSQFALLKTRRFLPFFLTQFLGAFNDNLFRNALIISVTYGATAAASSENAGLLANAAQGLFILPFFLFSALAGQLADKYEKSKLIRQTRLAEVFLMVCAAAALYFGDVPSLLWLVFLLGVLATIFGPLKYSLMPQHLRQSELVGGNALVDAGTFIAILIGTISGGLLAPNSAAEHAAGTTSNAHVTAAATMVAVAVATYLCSRAIPRAEATDPGLKINFNPFTSTWQTIRFAAQTRAIFLSLLGISWFWLVGALILAQLPSYAHDVLGGDKTVYILLLTAFSVGTALGSLACEKLSGHKVEIGLVPLGSIGLTVFVLDLYFAHPTASVGGAALLTWREFVSADGWRVAMDCAFIGVFGGLFIVPLYSLILQRSAESHRARIIAANNILNAGFMVGAALLAILWLKFFSIPKLFILAAVLNAVVAIYIYSLVPEFLMRFLSWVFVNVMYRIKVKGLEHIPETGPALIVSNHVSFMDALVIGGSVRRPVRFVMDHNIFKIPVMGFIFRTARAIPIAPAREDAGALQKAFDRIDAELADGEVVCIFPEGKLTRDGEMNEFKKGVEKILERRPVPVIPMALRGLWGSFFSHREGKPAMSRPPKRFWSRIEVVVTAPVPGDDASATSLQKIVAGLRGEWQ
jgi:1-acyl-sn-glycerol-3-phosphate acyltransferase